MDVAAQPGQAIGRDISRGEIVEAEIDAFISKRHDRRVRDEGERDEEAAWRESLRRYNARRREEDRRAWCEYFGRIAASLRSRAEEYDYRAKALLEDRGEGGLLD